jgi:5-methylcytosine-specific restriction endonuclease McrA
MTAERFQYNTTAWKKLSAQCIARDSVCIQCGHYGDQTNPLTADHIIPRSITGPDGDTLDNLTTLCRTCNSTKGANVIWRGEYKNPRWV